MEGSGVFLSCFCPRPFCPKGQLLLPAMVELYRYCVAMVSLSGGPQVVLVGVAPSGMGDAGTGSTSTSIGWACWYQGRDAGTSAGTGWGCQSWGCDVGAGVNHGAGAGTGTVMLVPAQ